MPIAGRPALALAALATASTLLLVGCAATADSAGPEAGISVQDVWEDADRLVGQQVVVSAEVQRILSPRAFVVAGGDRAVDPLLVLHDAPDVPGASALVRVTGIVRQTLDFEQAGIVDDPVLQNELYETYGTEPYLEATAVTPLPSE